MLDITKELEQRIDGALVRARKTPPNDPSQADTLQHLRGELARAKLSSDVRFAKSALHIQHMVKKGALEDAGASSAAVKKLESAARHLAVEASDSGRSDEEIALYQKGRAIRGMPSSNDDVASLLAGPIQTVSRLETELLIALKQPAVAGK